MKMCKFGCKKEVTYKDRCSKSAFRCPVVIASRYNKTITRDGKDLCCHGGGQPALFGRRK